jgi:Domain of unknown function (DUF4136)
MKAPLAMLMMSLTFCGVVAVGASEYGVKVTVDKNTDFSALHTYAWTRGLASLDPAFDAHITEAIDRELGSVGLIRQGSEPADVVVSYGVVRRSDVDVSAKRDRDSGTYPEYSTGTFVVLMREASSRRELFRARAKVPIDVDIAQIERHIDEIVARMFAHYPTRVPDRL